MKLTALILIWMAPAIFVLIKNRLERVALFRRYLHDRILFAFCDVRDKIAIAAANGTISEESEIFNFFYTTNAQLIHHHSDMGICFASVVKQIETRYKHPKKRGDEPIELKRLRREMNNAAPEIKSVLGIWVRAMSNALFLNSPLFRLEVRKRMAEETAEKIKVQMEQLAKSRQQSKGVREVAEFGALVASAAA